MKKADLALEHVFLIVIGVIATIVIVGLITKWSFRAENALCTLRGDCNKPEIPLNDIVQVKDCQQAMPEATKHIEICSELGKQGMKEGICFVLTLPGTCGLSKNALESQFAGSGVKVNVKSIQPRMIISYRNGMVEVN
ncbi:MAG: hypothetical protein HY544_05500 [Candidatus Diapherotrites archaeon]|uniref:Uncharacterized protein n=1 Tax=Candidatus Iainarchaeum sp. TaxID=3101447 RepID=A0A8T3YNV2_9ARCH|nr:hypothetical protein [Candidatus Diapherotrites archaeon]